MMKLCPGERHTVSNITYLGLLFMEVAILPTLSQTNGFPRITKSKKQLFPSLGPDESLQSKINTSLHQLWQYLKDVSVCILAVKRGLF